MTRSPGASPGVAAWDPAPLNTGANPELSGLFPITRTAPQDIFVVGYPKSGNTWYQCLIAGVVYGCNPELTPDAVVQELVPDVHGKKFYHRFGERAFFKSHRLPLPEYRQVIYLLRDGRDAMVSYYHHLNALNADPVDFKALIGGHGLFPGKWQTHVEAWLSNPFGARLMVVRYEDLKTNCVGELRRLCEFLEMDRDSSWLALLAEAARFQKMQRREITQGWANPWPKDKLFVRRGDVGSYRDEMPPEILAQFLTEAGAALARAGYLEEAVESGRIAALTK